MYRHRVKEEDEETLRRQAYADNLNRKKELIKSEFDKLQDEQKCDELTIKSDNEIHFKNLLNEIKAMKVRKEEKLIKTDQNAIFFTGSTRFDSVSQKELRTSNTNINNTSFIKSFYKNKIFEAMSYKQDGDPEALRRKLAEVKQEIENTKINIETENNNKTSILNKVLELEGSKKKILFQMNDLNFAKKMTFKRFNNVGTLLFNAQTKKKLSLLHLNQIKNEMGQIKTIESDFFKQRCSLLQQEKHDIEKEQTELSKVLLQIDVTYKILLNYFFFEGF